MSGRLIIRNRSQYPTDEVRRLVRFGVRHLDMRGVCVNVKNARYTALRGRAYMGVPYISDAPPTADYLVTIGIGSEEHFPFPQQSAGDLIADWREALVFVAAHEGLHIEQFKERKRLSEKACDEFAYRMLREYRMAA
jgi:hypothetical protein